MRITLNGYVVADDDKWLYDWFDIGCFSPATVRQAILETPEGEDLEIEINSYGGSVFAGFEIYSALRAARCHTVAMVQSIAASAASTVMAGCTRVLLSPVAQVMIHLPETSTDGNRDDHLESIRILDSLTQSILNAYQLRCGDKTTRDRLEQLVHEAIWLPAQDAVELGLADDIMFTETEAAALPLSVVNAVGGGIRALASNAASMPNPTELRAQYHQMVATGAKPAADGHPAEPPIDEGTEPEPPLDQPGEEPAPVSDDWQRKSRLAIENNRFL